MNEEVTLFTVIATVTKLSELCNVTFMFLYLTNTESMRTVAVPSLLFSLLHPSFSDALKFVRLAFLSFSTLVHLP